MYRYFFQRQAETANGSVPASHGIELLYVFGTMLDLNFTPVAADADLAASMRAYWSSLAAGEPLAAGGAPAWPAYDAGLDSTRVLDAPIAVADGARTTECDFWDGLALPP